MIKWSASRIDSANYCRMRYYLKYNTKEKSGNLSVYEKGRLLHDIIEHFWPRKGTEEQFEKRKKTKKHYFDKVSFGEYAQRKWIQSVMGAERSGRQIDWRHEDEKWMIYSKLPSICEPLYEHLIKEGPPIYIELPFDFTFNGKRFTGICSRQTIFKLLTESLEKSKGNASSRFIKVHQYHLIIPAIPL